MKKVVLSPNLKVLNQGVFSYCGLTHVDFIVPFGLEEIRENAFFHSGSFELALPESVTKIGPGAFCFGPSVKTSLSRDGSWFSVWPYQETVRLKGGVYGKVVDYSLLSEKCGVLTVNVEEEIIHVFFPSVDGDYRFFKDQSQTRMEEYTIDGEVKFYYEAWIIGAFNYQSFYQADEFVKTENPRDRKMPSPDQPTDAEMIHKNNERISPDSDVVVSFANEAEVMLKLIAEREKEKERILSEAYDWALDQQRELQLVAQPLRLTFTNGDTIADEDGFTISVFYKKSTDEAILRRDWEDRMAISYNILTNFDEIAQIAPKSLNLMLKNGLKIKKRWEEGYGFFD